MKIYIPHADYPVRDKRELFILTRPFFINNNWIDDNEFKKQWNLDNRFILVSSIELSDVVLFPFSVNNYFEGNKFEELKKINNELVKNNKQGYAYISNDFGFSFPDFSNIIYYRLGGFVKQLSSHNKGFPVALSDHFQRIFNHDHPIPNEKSVKPIVSFCGHATLSFFKRIKENLKCVKENFKRAFQNPFRLDWEPLFASAYQRAKLIQSIKKNNKIQSNFILRNQYRAGAKNEQDLHTTTLEYYNNIADSDYVLCVRGAGNFSVRFYETLMMGKIPIFVNTDCLLPFENQINWKQHVVWIEWKDRKNIAQMVFDFHKQLSNEDFIQMQLNNRKLWKETLSVKGMLEMIANDI